MLSVSYYRRIVKKEAVVMHRVFQKEQILTIPNLLSLVRIGLIPVIIWLYCVKKEYTLAVAVIFLSGVTDIVDGWIARHFNMVSDFGKILDPLADKLTQATMIICLTVKYKLMYGIIGLFAFKEILMSTLGLLVIRKRDAVNSAKWHGKVNTVILYTVMMLLILFPGLPKPLANTMIVLIGCMMLISLCLYAKFYIGELRNQPDQSE